MNLPCPEVLIPEYCIRKGSGLERSLLVKFMQRTYREMFPDQDFSHLAQTVEQYYSKDTPLWWVEFLGNGQESSELKSRETQKQEENIHLPPDRRNALRPNQFPVACLWAGNAVDQVTGDRHAHVFLLYVMPEHRRRGIAKALMRYLENWAKIRGDRQIGLQVFQSNTNALNLYNQLGYQTQSLWMVKFLG